MNTIELEKTLCNYKPTFLGVFSSDNLPEKPGLMVCNTDTSRERGTHWIAIYIDAERRYGEYFDSFGRKPTATFRDYLNRHCKHWIFNDRQLQSVASRFCGHYCIYYCVLRCSGIDLRKIVNQFTNDQGYNDVLVHGFVCTNKR
jgi:hypothetical protein